jgi:hypothetical protein
MKRKLGHLIVLKLPTYTRYRPSPLGERDKRVRTTAKTKLL